MSSDILKCLAGKARGQPTCPIIHRDRPNIAICRLPIPFWATICMLFSFASRILVSKEAHVLDYSSADVLKYMLPVPYRYVHVQRSSEADRLLYNAHHAKPRRHCQRHPSDQIERTMHPQALCRNRQVLLLLHI